MSLNDSTTTPSVCAKKPGNAGRVDQCVGLQIRRHVLESRRYLGSSLLSLLDESARINILGRTITVVRAAVQPGETNDISTLRLGAWMCHGTRPRYWTAHL